MLLNPNPSTPTAMFGMASRWLIKVSLVGGMVWFGYQLANQLADPHNRLHESPVATIVFLALALTAAAYVVMRQREHLAARTQSYSAIDDASDAVVITDGEGTIEYVNPAFTRMTGYSAAEVIGINPRRQKPGLGSAFQQQVRE